MDAAGRSFTLTLGVYGRKKLSEVVKGKLFEINESFADDSLVARSENTLRGIFEYFQEQLTLKFGVGSALTREAIWERFLSMSHNLYSHVYQKTGWWGISYQAEEFYKIYDVLSKHIHDSQALAKARFEETTGEWKVPSKPLHGKQARALEAIGDYFKLKLKVGE